jgi:hypothetical protein
VEQSGDSFERERLNMKESLDPATSSISGELKANVPQHLWNDLRVFNEELAKRHQRGDILALFKVELERRLCKGYEEYGDSSFEMDPVEIFKEWEQEFFDIPGWGFILWKRLRNSNKRLPIEIELEFFSVVCESVKLWGRIQEIKKHLTE